MLGLLEKQSEMGDIDLFYGDESRISEAGYVPYGWVFKDEKVEVPAQKGKSLNIWGLLSRDSQIPQIIVIASQSIFHRLWIS